MAVSTADITNDKIALTDNIPGNKIFNYTSSNMKFLLEKQRVIYKSAAYIFREPKTIPKTLNDFITDDITTSHIPTIKISNAVIGGEIIGNS